MTGRTGKGNDGPGICFQQLWGGTLYHWRVCQYHRFPTRGGAETLGPVAVEGNENTHAVRPCKTGQAAGTITGGCNMEQTYGVWAVRSAASIFGHAESWCKENSKPLEFDSREAAEAYAREMNSKTTANVLLCKGQRTGTRRGEKAHSTAGFGCLRSRRGHVPE